MTPMEMKNAGQDPGGDAVPSLHPLIKVGMGDEDTQNIASGNHAD